MFRSLVFSNFGIILCIYSTGCCEYSPLYSCRIFGIRTRRWGFSFSCICLKIAGIAHFGSSYKVTDIYNLLRDFTLSLDHNCRCHLWAFCSGCSLCTDWCLGLHKFCIGDCTGCRFWTCCYHRGQVLYCWKGDTRIYLSPYPEFANSLGHITNIAGHCRWDSHMGTLSMIGWVKLDNVHSHIRICFPPRLRLRSSPHRIFGNRMTHHYWYYKHSRTDINSRKTIHKLMGFLSKSCILTLAESLSRKIRNWMKRINHLLKE